MSWSSAKATMCIAAAAASVASSGSPTTRDKPVHPEELGLQLPKNFFAKTFERRWASLPGPKGARELFRSLWSKSQVLRHAREKGFKAYERGFSRSWADSEGGETGAREAQAALRNNFTLVQNHVHRQHAPLARHMRLVTAFFGLPGGMNSYTTPPTGQGFAYHFDPSDAFILQVEGTKAWEICKRRLPNPFGFADPTYNQVPPEHSDAQGCSKLTLQEGDAVYLPIGQIHRAVASEGPSVHLTMSLNRQFLSKSAMLLNVAEQINPSKEYGFSQKTFLEWVHRTSADTSGLLKANHDVPRALLCIQGVRHAGGHGKNRRCPAEKGFLDPDVLGVTGREEPLSLALEEKQTALSEEMLTAYKAELAEAIAALRAHPSASERLKMGMRINGQPEPVVGQIPAGQVLDGLAPLLSPLACSKAIAAWREFFARQAAEYDESALRPESLDEDETEAEEIFQGLEEDDEVQDPLMESNNRIQELTEDLAREFQDVNDAGRQGKEIVVEQATSASVPLVDVDIDSDIAGDQQSPEKASQDLGLEGITFVDLGEEDALEKQQSGIYSADFEDTDHDGALMETLHEEVHAAPSCNTTEAEIASGFAWDYPEESSNSVLAGSEHESLMIALKEELVATKARCAALEEQLQGERAARAALEVEVAHLRLNSAASAASEQAPPSMERQKRRGSTTSTTPPSSAAKCCSSSSASAQVRCANQTAPPERSEDPSRVLIITYATPHVHSYARYALPVNANWAQRFGHSFVVDTRDRADGTVDVKNAKVLVKHHWVSRPGLSEKWALWIGADAILADFGGDREDVLRRIIAEHGKDPRVQIIITRDPTGRAGNSMSLFNADVILLRRSEWTSHFLMRWWEDPRMKEGRTDQEVLELLYTEDVLGAANAFVLLPPLALNSETLSIVAAPPRMQPVIHLGGHADSTRSAVFKEALAMVCQRKSGPDPDSSELQEVYLKALWQEVQTPGSGISSGHMHGSTLLGAFQRLAYHMEERQRADEAISVQRAALKLGEERFGLTHRDTLHAATALGGTLRAHDRMGEAETLHRRAHRGFVGTLGWENRDTLTSANNLGLALEAMDRPREAEPLFRKARRGLINTVGANALSTLSTTLNLATLLAEQTGRQKAVSEAYHLHRQALAGREAVLGPNHPDTLETTDALAQFLVTSGRAGEAEPVARKALNRRTANAGALDTRTVMSTSTLAQALKLQGHKHEAAAYFELAFARCRETPGLGGPSGPNALAAGSNLASALQDLGRTAEAGALYKQAAVGLRRALGKDHPNTRSAKLNYEQFLRESGGNSAASNDLAGD